MRSNTFAVVLTALTLAATGLSCSVSATPEPEHASAGSLNLTAPADAMKPAPPGPLPKIPYEGYAPSRPMEVVQEVYEFAARHPEVLQYVPCFCGCDRSAGHRGNHDCFVKQRAADGRIIEWDSHGYGCAICIDVARDSMQMFNAGAKPASIRAAIDSKYGSRGPNTMNTPHPPAAPEK